MRRAALLLGSATLLVLASSAAAQAPAPLVPRVIVQTVPLAPGELPCQAPCVAPGELSMASRPWTEVFVDGARVGDTPLYRARLLPGDHELVLVNEARGLRHRQQIEVPAATAVKVKVDFGAATDSWDRLADSAARRARQLNADCGEDLRNPGFVSVDSRPWSRVFVDGELVGSTPLYRLPLAPGAHVVVLRGARPEQLSVETVTIASGQQLKLERKLARDASAALADR